MNWLFSFFKSGLSGGLGDLGNWLVQTVSGGLKRWGVVAFIFMLIINMATFLSNFFSSIQLQLGTTAPESVRFILDLAFAVAPPNFQSSISLVMSIGLTKVGLKFYVLVIGNFTSGIKLK
jgi:hypothetical protein